MKLKRRYTGSLVAFSGACIIALLAANTKGGINGEADVCISTDQCNVSYSINDKDIMNEVTSLNASLEAFKSHFNANKDKKRFVALLSPVCKWCIEGAYAIKKSVLNNSEAEDLSISITWIDMLEGDNLETARQASKILQHPKIKQFHDSEQYSGKELMRAFGGKKGVAWDIYMVYDEGVTWADEAPLPLNYVHQLGENHPWANPGRFKTGDALVSELELLVNNVTIKQ